MLSFHCLNRTDLPPAHKPAPPPPKKKNSDMKGHLTSDDIQVQSSLRGALRTSARLRVYSWCGSKSTLQRSIFLTSGVDLRYHVPTVRVAHAWLMLFHMCPWKVQGCDPLPFHSIFPRKNISHHRVYYTCQIKSSFNTFSFKHKSMTLSYRGADKDLLSLAAWGYTSSTYRWSNREVLQLLSFNSITVFINARHHEL